MEGSYKIDPKDVQTDIMAITNPNFDPKVMTDAEQAYEDAATALVRNFAKTHGYPPGATLFDLVRVWLIYWALVKNITDDPTNETPVTAYEALRDNYRGYAFAYVKDHPEEMPTCDALITALREITDAETNGEPEGFTPQGYSKRDAAGMCVFAYLTLFYPDALDAQAEALQACYGGAVQRIVSNRRI